MKKLTKVILSAAAVAAMGCTMAMSFTACGGNEETSEINISGSTSVHPLMKKLAAAFEEKNENVIINVNAGGSAQGIADAKNGSVDFGMASKAVDEDGLTATQIATDGIVCIVNQNCTVDSVTAEELKALYLDGTAIQGAITMGMSREDGSGTRDAFMELTDMKGQTLFKDNGFEELTETNTVISNILTDTAGNKVGYISLGSLSDNVKALKFNGVEATVANINNRTYALSRPFNIVYRTGQLTDIAQQFVDFIMGSEGQAIVAAEGYIQM